MVPLLDPTRQYQQLKTELDAAAIAVLASGQFILGPFVERFEASAAEVLNVPHAMGVANGTDALQLALQSAGVGPGDEVIVPPFTFIATAEVVSLLGATPVFVDIEPQTFNIDPAKVEAAITPKTKALVPVHLYGHPAQMQELKAIAQKHHLFLLEDAAQAWGATLEIDGTTHHCGAMGDAAGFSFYPTKNLGACGEGGLVTFQDDALAEKCHALRNHGQSRRYIHDLIGYNSRLQAMQAALLQVKLKYMDAANSRRREIAHHYSAAIAGTSLIPPSEKPGAYHVYHQYTLRVSDGAARREAITDKLTEAGIGWAIYYPVPLHQQPVYENLGYAKGAFPVAEQAAEEVLSLPIFPELRDDEVELVVKVLLDVA
jgi:dTDP-4-amino-4,6-dideoxygalactose transaminase